MLADQLTFDLVDDVALAMERGRAPRSLQLEDAREDGRLGPLIELSYLRYKRMPAPRILRADQNPSVDALRTALRSTRSSPRFAGPRYGSGFIRPSEIADKDSTDAMTLFLARAQQAAERAGFSKRFAQGLVGAAGELEDNIRLHSGAVSTGLLAYQATSNGKFELVIADAGIGVLQSLRKAAAYRRLNDSGHALRIALSDGASRFGPRSGHGLGFRPLFQSLASHYGDLRFRSGDHVLNISGVSATLSQATVAERARIPGLIVSILCSTWSAR